MLPVFWGVRIVTEGVAVADSAVPAVIDDLDALAPRRLAGGVHRVALAVVVGRVPRGLLAPHGPSVFPRNHVNVVVRQNQIGGR